MRRTKASLIYRRTKEPRLGAVQLLLGGAWRVSQQDDRRRHRYSSSPADAKPPHPCTKQSLNFRRLAPFGKHLRNHRGIEPVADFRFPDFGRNEPFTVRPTSLPPTRPIVDRPRIGIAQGIEAALAMLFDKEPHLFDGLPGLGRFRAAAPFNPLRQRPSRRAARLALLMFTNARPATSSGRIAPLPPPRAARPAAAYLVSGKARTCSLGYLALRETTSDDQS
jgi:hypothetical protein